MKKKLLKKQKIGLFLFCLLVCQVIHTICECVKKKEVSSFTTTCSAVLHTIFASLLKRLVCIYVCMYVRSIGPFYLRFTNFKLKKKETNKTKTISNWRVLADVVVNEITEPYLELKLHTTTAIPPPSLLTPLPPLTVLLLLPLFILWNKFFPCFFSLFFVFGFG